MTLLENFDFTMTYFFILCHYYRKIIGKKLFFIKSEKMFKLKRLYINVTNDPNDN